MALPTSGALTMDAIQTEFGGANPISMSEYYAGGTYVLSGVSGTNGAVPASPNSISFSNFYGTNGRRSVAITISGTENYNYVLNTAKAANYMAGKMDVTLTIASGARVGSSSVGSYALTVDTSWNSGDTITIVNNGTIAGRGGAGGAGGSSSVGGNGGVGGPAMYIQRAVTINNAGTIAGGGGGGGGGAFNAYTVKTTSYNDGGSGGGGGRGWVGGSGGALGTGTTSNGVVGGDGTFTGGGAGGNGTGGDGGAGGTFGGSGTAGTTTASAAGGSGGAGGNYINGNSFVTWSATGTRFGGAV